ncbi:hypothetical protein GQ457_17G001100 [Hibiscus cannabinus]
MSLKLHHLCLINLSRTSRPTAPGHTIAKITAYLTWRAIPYVFHNSECMGMHRIFDFVSKLHKSRIPEIAFGMKRVVTFGTEVEPVVRVAFILTQITVVLGRTRIIRISQS